MRQDYALAVLVELDNLERKFLAECSLCAVFLYEVLRSCEAFNTLLERYHVTLLECLDDLALVYAAHSVYCFKHIPWVVFQLLVAEAQATVLFVYLKNYDVDVCTNLGEL